MLMVPVLQCKLTKGRKESMKDKKGKLAEAGEIVKLGRFKSLCTKGGHRCAEQKEW